MATDNTDAAKAFYGGLFDWSYVDFLTDRGGVYTQFTCRDLPVAGLGEMSEEMKAGGMPAFWNSYVTVDDADACAATAEELGDIPDQLVRMLPARIAIRYQAVPFRLSGPRVEIAMLEVEVEKLRQLLNAAPPRAGDPPTEQKVTIDETVPHARINGIDFSEAEKVPGFVRAFTHEDVPKNIYTILCLIGVEPDDEPVLAADRVRYKGEQIAAIVAETEQAALEAFQQGFEFSDRAPHFATAIATALMRLDRLEEARQHAELLSVDGLNLEVERTKKLIAELEAKQKVAAAEEILQTVLKQYPESKAAESARRMLDETKSQPEAKPELRIPDLGDSE